MRLPVQLAAVKQSEEHLQAALRGAQKRADAATALAQSLKEAVRLASAKLDTLQPPAGSGAAHADGAAGEVSGAQLVARQRAQLAGSAREAAALRDELQAAQQVSRDAIPCLMCKWECRSPCSMEAVEGEPDTGQLS